MNELLNNVSGITSTWVILIILLVLFIFTGIKRVDEGRAKIVERLGKRHKIIYPGLSAIIPIIDKVKTSNVNLETIVNGKRLPLYNSTGITLAEQRMDPISRKLIAKDNSEINVDPIAYFRIVDPIKLVYDVSDFAGAFETLIETTLRQEVGKYDGDTIVQSRDTLSDNLKKSLQEAATSWGVQVLRVEIEDLSFDSKVEEFQNEARFEKVKRRAEMEAQKAEAEQLVVMAEAEKDANILKAEGEKQARIRRAEGVFEEDKLKAEGEFLLESRKQEGVAEGFAAISKALRENPESIVALESLKAQAKVADSLGKSENTLIIPTETAGLFGAIASVTKVLDIVNTKRSIPKKQNNIKSEETTPKL